MTEPSPTPLIGRPQTVPILSAYPIITDLLPRNAVSLIVGSAYSGKTMLLYSAAAEYLQSAEFLGHPAPRHPDSKLPMTARLGYISGNRPRSRVAAAIHACLLTSVLNPIDFPVVSLLEQTTKDDCVSFADLYESFPEPRPQFLLVDCLPALMPSGKVNEFAEVGQFMRSLTRFCQDREVTILATTLQAKIKRGEKEYSPCDRALGTSAWTMHVETQMALEYDDPKQVIPTRKLTILTSRAYPETLWLDFDANGRLVQTMVAADWQEILIRRLDELPEGKPIATVELIAWGRDVGKSHQSIELWIQDQLRASRLERIKRGTYRRPYRT